MLTPKPKYLVGMFLVLVGLGCFLSYRIYAEAKTRAIAELNTRQMILARQAKTGIENHFRETIQILDRLARMPNIVEMSPAGREKLDFAFQINRGEIQAIARLSAAGSILYNTPFQEGVIGADISGQAHIRKILQSHEPVVSDVFPAVEGFRAIALHVPVFQNRRFRGTLGVLIDFKKLSRRFLEGIRIGETGYARGGLLKALLPQRTGRQTAGGAGRMKTPAALSLGPGAWPVSRLSAHSEQRP